MRVELRAEFAALCNDSLDLQISDPRKIHIGVGKCAMALEGIPTPLGNRGP